MIMKFNWGVKITAVYILFVMGIMYLVIQSSRQSVDLVTPDYYAEEIQYQEKINQTRRAEALSAPIQYSLREQLLEIRFPSEFKGKEINGTVLLYYPADSKKDLTVPIRTEANKMTLTIPDKSSGMHILQVTWKSGGEAYYFEEPLFIP
jgi:hypothetical protein